MGKYQKLASELDKLMEDMHSSDTDIDEMIIKYEKASKVISEMEEHLKLAENKIQKINSGAKS